MPLTSLQLQNFTAFAKLDLAFSPGVNILVGANGTGKTHVMKVCYAACDVSRTQMKFADKLVRVFLPSGRSLGRLVHRRQGTARGSVVVNRDDLTLRDGLTLRTEFPNRAFSPSTKGEAAWMKSAMESVYIPVKEMLSNAPGFLPLYFAREIHFEEIYADILLRAYTDPLRGPADSARRKMLQQLEKAVGGKVRARGQEFFLRNKQGRLEFTLLAEGVRKLGLLWLLVQNGTLRDSSVLFWDEPETNLNPTLFGVVVDVLLELQRQGVQVFLATHNYVVLKEFDLRMQKSDNVLFHSFYRTEEGEIACNSTTDYLAIEPNAIAQAFSSLYEREIDRSTKGL